MNRKSIPLRFVLFAIILVPLNSFGQKNFESGRIISDKYTERPNIIFILTDDQRWDAMGAMGNPVIMTPNMDKLATAGILFQNAYVTTSICAVSRASIFTGQYQSRHKISDFKTDLDSLAFSETYPILLKDNGYKIGFIGKFGVGHHPPGHLFDFWSNISPEYLVKGKNDQKIHNTDSVNNAIQEFLDHSGRDKPFCLSISFKAPHEEDGNPPTYIIQPKYKEYYKNVTIPEPVTAKPEYWNQFPDFFRTDSNFARVRWKGLFGTPELYQENVKNYYRLITGVDDVVGNMMKKLDELGIAENTIIILMGDNGMFLGEHGMEGKWYGYEESIRVPLFIYDPLLPDKIKNIRPRQIALNIDIAPTILSLAGIPIPKNMQGVNLVAVVENKIPERKDFFYQHYFVGSPGIPKEEGVVTQELKYMKYIEHNYEEIYDIKYDPHETKNLAYDSRYKKNLDRLRKRLKQLKKEAE